MKPPIIVWFRAAALASVMLVVFIRAAMNAETPASDAFHDFNRARIQDFLNAPPADERELRILLLGNSRLRYAADDGAKMSNRARSIGLGHARFLRVVANGAVFGDFVPLLGDLERIRPDVIVMQADLLVDERGQRIKPWIFRKYVIWKLFGLSPWSIFSDQEAMQFDTYCLNLRNLEAHLHKVNKWLDANLDDEEKGRSSEAAKAFVRDQSAHGTSVLLVPIPKAEELERVRPSNDPRIVSAATELNRESEVVHFSVFPGSMSQQYFCDVTHMNPEGRDLFSDWLLSEIVAAIDTSDEDTGVRPGNGKATTAHQFSQTLP